MTYQVEIERREVVRINYKIEVYTLDTDNGLEYYAHYPSIGGISGGGATAQEAIEVLESRIFEHLDFMEQHGYTVPAPDFDWGEE